LRLSKRAQLDSSSPLASPSDSFIPIAETEHKPAPTLRDGTRPCRAWGNNHLFAQVGALCLDGRSRRC
jgi:hypothetical protein